MATMHKAKFRQWFSEYMGKASYLLLFLRFRPHQCCNAEGYRHLQRTTRLQRAHSGWRNVVYSARVCVHDSRDGGGGRWFRWPDVFWTLCDGCNDADDNSSRTFGTETRVRHDTRGNATVGADFAASRDLFGRSRPGAVAHGARADGRKFRAPTDVY